MIEEKEGVIMPYLWWVPTKVMMMGETKACTSVYEGK